MATALGPWPSAVGALRRAQRRSKPYTRNPALTVHDLDAPAGGEAQAALRGPDDHARRAAPLRARLHHVHAYRLDDSVRAGADGRARPGAGAFRPRVGSPRRRAAGISKVKNAQEAHEAIRPAGDRFRTPDLARELDRDQLGLYDLVWRRTLASQMADARGETVSVRLGAKSTDGEDAEFGASGTVITFRGFLAAYEEGRDDDVREDESAAAEARAGPGTASHGARAEATRPHRRPLHRGDARAGARGARHRPAVDLRGDHRHDPGPRLRLQEGHGARAVVRRLRRRAAPGAPLRPARRLRLHGQAGGRPRPHRGRRRGAAALARPLLLRRRRRRGGCTSW